MLRGGLTLAFLAAAIVLYRHGALWEGLAASLAGLAVVLPRREKRRREFYCQKTSDRGLERLQDLADFEEGAQS